MARCSLHPLERLGIVPVHAMSARIAEREFPLCGGMVALGCRSAPHQGRCSIPRDAIPRPAPEIHVVLGVRFAAIGGRAHKPRRPRFVF